MHNHLIGGGFGSRLAGVLIVNKAPLTPKPSRHRTTSSINASLGNPDRRPPATRDAGQAHAGGRWARDASSLTLAKHPHPGLPGPRDDP